MFDARDSQGIRPEPFCRIVLAVGLRGTCCAAVLLLARPTEQKSKFEIVAGLQRMTLAGKFGADIFSVPIYGSHPTISGRLHYVMLCRRLAVPCEDHAAVCAMRVMRSREDMVGDRVVVVYVRANEKRNPPGSNHPRSPARNFHGSKSKPYNTESTQNKLYRTEDTTAGRGETMQHRNRRDLLGSLVVASVVLASVCNGFVVRCTRLPSRLGQIPLIDSSAAAAAVSTGTTNNARRARPRRKSSLHDLACLTKIPRWAYW